MDIRKLRRWIRLKIDTIELSRLACLTQGDSHHQKGRELEGEAATSEWEQAERFHAAAKDIRDARYEDKPPVMKNCSDDSVHDNKAPVHTQTMKVAPVQKVEISERTLSIIAFGFATAAFVMSFWAQSDNQRLREEILKSERESRVLQQQVMDQSALLLREGLRQPDDFTNGPSGNLNYHRKEPKQ